MLNPTPIEWVVNPDGSKPGYTYNPITGCLGGCGFCWAKRLANGRLKPKYLANNKIAPTDFVKDGKLIHVDYKKALNDPFYPRFWAEKDLLPKSKKPRGIFPVDMGDLFGIGVPEIWTRRVLALAYENPQDRFYLLTKQAQNLIKFSPFPENCWVGVSTTGNDCNSGFEDIFASIHATVKFVSIEPLKDYTPMDFRWVDWAIVGAETKNGKPVKENLPQISWIKDIIKDCDALGKPVFLKNNLMSVLPFDPIFREKDKHGVSMSFLRQEFPEVKVGVK
ncbi:MAG: DUF5131 family protein [Lutibacter sp.]|jgi:protein gp37